MGIFQPFSRAVYFSTINTTMRLPPNRMCFTFNNPTNFFYKPHSDLGRVGTTSTAYRAQRKRI